MGHGTHWEVVLKSFDQDFAAALDIGIQSGEVIGKAHRQNWSGPVGIPSAEVTLIQNARSGLGVLAVVVSAASKSFLHTAFPVAAQGIPHRVRILEVFESSFGLEACISASIGEAKINFFDPYYGLCSHLYTPGLEMDVSLASIGYLLSVLERGQAIKHPELGETRLDGAAVLLPINDPLPAPLPIDGFGLSYIHSSPERPGLDDYHFRAPVKSIESVDFLTRPASRLNATVLRSNNGRKAVDIALYVLDDKVGEVRRPYVGEDVTGALWLQGTAFGVN